MQKNANRLSKQYTQTIYAGQEQVFSLLCPAEEARWLDGWSYHMIYSKSGIAEAGCIFTTPEGEKKAIWINSLRDQPNGQIQFVKVIPDITVTLLDIQLARQEELTRVTISYTTTALSKAGEHALELITDSTFQQRLKLWEQSMNHYLKTGNKLEQAA